jgi:hypothetical protein
MPFFLVGKRLKVSFSFYCLGEKKNLKKKFFLKVIMFFEKRTENINYANNRNYGREGQKPRFEKKILENSKKKNFLSKSLKNNKKKCANTKKQYNFLSNYKNLSLSALFLTMKDV